MLCARRSGHCLIIFFFNDTATTEIYTLSLHDALPISLGIPGRRSFGNRTRSPSISRPWVRVYTHRPRRTLLRTCRIYDGSKPDRKSTRLNSSHGYISYAVFCLKKKIELASLPAQSSGV